MRKGKECYRTDKHEHGQYEVSCKFCSSASQASYLYIYGMASPLFIYWQHTTAILPAVHCRTHDFWIHLQVILVPYTVLLITAVYSTNTLLAAVYCCTGACALCTSALMGFGLDLGLALLLSILFPGFEAGWRVGDIPVSTASGAE